MSIMAIRPDRNRCCFRACFPGTFCACLGKYIPNRSYDPILEEIIVEEVIDSVDAYDDDTSFSDC